MKILVKLCFSIQHSPSHAPLPFRLFISGRRDGQTEESRPEYDLDPYRLKHLVPGCFCHHRKIRQNIIGFSYQYTGRNRLIFLYCRLITSRDTKVPPRKHMPRESMFTIPVSASLFGEMVPARKATEREQNKRASVFKI